MGDVAVDAVRLNFNPTSLLVLNIAIGVMMLGVALDLKLADFKRIIKSPKAPGIGLAATQVNIAQRIIVIDISKNKSEPLCLINPEILSRSGEEEMEEGCLSVPGYYETVRRAEKVKIRALGRDGQAFELEADDLLAVCIQHEIDHLDGKLFVDYLSPLKRQRIKKKLEKQTRQGTLSKNTDKQVI